MVGQVDEHVGLEAAGAAVFFGARAAGLHDVFAPFGEAGIFEHGFQNHFAPIALAFVLRAGEGLGERFGVSVQLAVEALQAFELVFKGEPLFGFFFVSGLHQLAELAHALVERVEQAGDAFLVVLAEFFAFFVENIVGEVLKLIGEALARFGQKGELFFGRQALLLDLGGEALVAHLQIGMGLLQGGKIGFQTA